MQSVHKDENSPRIVVVGDSILDVYCLGKNDGGEPPRFSWKSQVSVPGGAGNVVSNIRALGGYPLLFSKVGTDAASIQYIRRLTRRGISTRYIRTCADSGISVKTRYCEGERIFRADRDFMNVQTEREAYRLMQDIQALIPPYQAVVFSDYAKGFCSGTLYRLLSGYCYRKAIHLFVDSKSLFPPAFAYVYKPNWWEFEQRLGHRIRNRDELPTQARAFQKKYRIQHLIVTMDKQGVLWMDPEGEPHWYPPLTAKVVNSCGAGDSFLAALAVADGKGITMQDAIPLANKAAGSACRHPGTYTVKACEIFDERD